MVKAVLALELGETNTYVSKKNLVNFVLFCVLKIALKADCLP